jgi:hypothetical protein
LIGKSMFLIAESPANKYQKVLFPLPSWITTPKVPQNCCSFCFARISSNSKWHLQGLYEGFFSGHPHGCFPFAMHGFGGRTEPRLDRYPSGYDYRCANWNISMDWFKGKYTAPYLMGKSMVSCRFSLKPIHWTLPFLGKMRKSSRVSLFMGHFPWQSVQ